MRFSSSPRRRVWPILALLPLGLAVAAFLWPRDDGRPRAGSRLRVIFSGETKGELEPCHCSDGPDSNFGGLPRRAGFLAEARGQGAFLLLDLGCLGAGVREFELLRMEAVLRAMSGMGYHAVNVGEHELWLGGERFQRLAQAVPVPWVSANVMRSGGRPAADLFRVVRVANLDVAVTGVVAKGRYLAGPELELDDPLEALARVLPQMTARAGIVVVLADLDPLEIDALAERFPEIALLLYRGRGDSRPPGRVNRSWVAAVAGEGRFMGDVTLTWNAPGSAEATGAAVVLDRKFPELAEATRASIDWYREQVRGRKFDLTLMGPGWTRIAADRPPEGDRYVGSAACAGCHETEYKSWKASAHAHSMASLEKARYEFSPECVVCHVVGYGAPDGYTLAAETPELAQVGCEACHGRAGLHAKAPPGKPVRLAPAGEASCQKCHTPERSFGFEFAKAWLKIRHGPEKKEQRP